MSGEYKVTADVPHHVYSAKYTTNNVDISANPAPVYSTSTRQATFHLNVTNIALYSSAGTHKHQLKNKWYNKIG